MSWTLITSIHELGTQEMLKKRTLEGVHSITESIQDATHSLKEEAIFISMTTGKQVVATSNTENEPEPSVLQGVSP